MVGAVWPGIDGWRSAPALSRACSWVIRRACSASSWTGACAWLPARWSRPRRRSGGGWWPGRGRAAAAHLILGLGARRFGRVSLRAFSSSTSGWARRACSGRAARHASAPACTNSEIAGRCAGSAGRARPATAGNGSAGRGISKALHAGIVSPAQLPPCVGTDAATGGGVCLAGRLRLGNTTRAGPAGPGGRRRARGPRRRRRAAPGRPDRPVRRGTRTPSGRPGTCWSPAAVPGDCRRDRSPAHLFHRITAVASGRSGPARPCPTAPSRRPRCGPGRRAVRRPCRSGGCCCP